MSDINTVSLSGVLVGDVETAKAKGMSVARFFIEVEGAGDRSARGNFKAVAFAEWADVAKNLSEGDRVVLVGALLDRSARGGRKTEIRVRNLIRLPRTAQEAENWQVKPVDEDEDDDEEDEETDDDD